MKRTGQAALLLLVFILLSLNAFAGEQRLSRRWLFVFREMTTPEAVEQTLALMPRAKAAGYNAIVLSDGHIRTLDLMPASYAENIKKLQETAAFYGMDLIPCVMPIGYAGSLLSYDRNLAEGLPVKDTLFAARGDSLVHVAGPEARVTNGDFERAADDLFPGWPYQMGSGRNVFADRKSVHQGNVSVRMVASGAPEDPLLAQVVKVKPFRQYHLSVWVKTEDLGRPNSAALGVATRVDSGKDLSYTRLGVAEDQDWTEHHIVFNSFDNEEVVISLRAGSRGGGQVWWDALSIEEVALLNVLRRPGCPLKVVGEDGFVYEEGRDFEHIHDPALQPSEVYHEPPSVRLTAASRIKDGLRVHISYYHPVLIHSDQVVGCLSEPLVYDLMRKQVKQVNDLLHPSVFFMQHDEIRVANWDYACQSRDMTPAQLLADNVRRCVEIIREVQPKAEIWVWSDMFDPMHNARAGDYYLVNGSWEGSWEGLEPSIGIVNWAGYLRGRNLKWFSDRGHQQILSGYYDRDETGERIESWLKAGEGLPGVSGAMYTSWEEKFDALEVWAEKAWGRPE